MLDEAPQGNEQPTREGHDADAPRSAATAPKALRVPPDKCTVGLPAQPLPSKFNHQRTYAWVAGLADPLVALHASRVVRATAQADAAGQFTAIVEGAPAEELTHQCPGAHLADGAQSLQALLLSAGLVV